MVTVAARQPRFDDAAMSGSAPGSWAGWKLRTWGLRPPHRVGTIGCCRRWMP